MDSSQIERTLLDAISASRGHFLYESGHHGDLWLDLDALFLNARRTQGWALALAQRATVSRPEFICGPLTGGAFLAQLLAAEMGCHFVFAERFVSETRAVQYHVPESLRKALRGGRVLLVDDAVNAGSALLSTLTDLLECGSKLAGFASLLTLGEAAAHIAMQYGVPFFTLAPLERAMWVPEKCPLCDSGVPLVNHLTPP